MPNEELDLNTDRDIRKKPSAAISKKGNKPDTVSMQFDGR